MNTTIEFEKNTKDLIDDLKSVCASYGLGNDGNEFKVITQVFLYKFMNDKFVYELKTIDPKLKSVNDIELTINGMSANELDLLLLQVDENTAIVKPEYFISSLFNKQNEPNFDQIFDNALLGIAKDNNDLFSVMTESGEKIVLFENISNYVTDDRDEFCKSIVNKLVKFSFENIFNEKFDFFSTIFEYLIKDYNTNSGGKYAEYFTPHSVSKIMAKCLVNGYAQNVSCYDPSAGSGTLLMNLAHQIGEDKCSIYSQDISQKSSHLLRLNLILNNLVHSIPNIIKGNTIKDPYHSENGELRKFDYIVSNPPFKLDFSDYRDDLESDHNNERFFAGIPKVPAKKKESMAIYFLFIQHIMYSLKADGKAAIVVPTGFLTAQSGIGLLIRKKLVEDKMLAGVITMPSNIFAKTRTNVSVIFIDKENKDDVILIDASNLGKTVKEEGHKKTNLLIEDEEQIVKTFTTKEVIEDFSVLIPYEDLKIKNYSFSAGQYFEVKIKYVEISQNEYNNKMEDYKSKLNLLFDESKKSELRIKKNIDKLNYE